MFTLFPHINDLDLVYDLVGDWTARFFPLLPYRRLLQASTATDDVHDEVPLVDRVYDDWSTIRGFIKPADEQQPQSMYGIELQRDVILEVSVPDLIIAKLATQDDTSKEVTLIGGVGDWFRYSQSVIYEVEVFVRGQMFGNTDIPIFYQIKATKVRDEAIDYAGI